MYILVVLLLLSFILAWRSLLHQSKMDEIKKLKEKLKKGRVVFQSK